MFCVSLRACSNRGLKCAFASVIIFATASVNANAQRPKASEEPLFSEFKGVRIGMPTDEARKKLGSPKDKADDLDLWVFNDTQAVQVYYDKTKAVSAISIDYYSGATDIPSSKEIVGAEPDLKPNGSAYKMVRYPKAGFWVSYSKTAGSTPTITITMQKIEH